MAHEILINAVYNVVIRSRIITSEIWCDCMHNVHRHTHYKASKGVYFNKYIEFSLNYKSFLISWIRLQLFIDVSLLDGKTSWQHIAYRKHTHTHTTWSLLLRFLKLTLSSQSFSRRIENAALAHILSTSLIKVKIPNHFVLVHLVNWSTNSKSNINSKISTTLNQCRN